jgi:LmbE family N-acetylglucosaminyl deacetylase
MKQSAFAIAAHADDIEFMMAGTLMLLKEAGYEIHYMNLANGGLGTAELSRDEIVEIRAVEAREADKKIGAIWHPPICEDVEILYEKETYWKLGAVIREAAPQVLLVPSLLDYMEDHTNTARLAVTAAFCRGMKNFPADQPDAPVQTDMAVYHALPYGLHDQLRNPVLPHFCVDVTPLIERKREMLACHRSQKEWLDRSQGIDSYLETMQQMCADMGKLSGEFHYAEGWQRHSHLGFGPHDYDPLCEALSGQVS